MILMFLKVTKNLRQSSAVGDGVKSDQLQIPFAS